MTNDGAVLTDRVAAQLRERIVSQVDAPGSTVTEAAVAALFGVARPTARLAIDRLVADGILRREPHQSARIPRLGRDDITDLYNTRAVLEAAALSALARVGTVPAEAIASHRALTEDATNFALHDIAFHRALVAGAPGVRLAHLHGLLMGEVELCIGQVQAAHLLTAAEVARQHQAILNAVVAGDAEDAARRVREHIEGARDALLRHRDD